jgi:hypothetical protein
MAHMLQPTYRHNRNRAWNNNYQSWMEIAGAETVPQHTRYQLREQELQALGKVSDLRQERRSRAHSRLAIHRRRFLVPSRIAFRLCSYARCRLDRYGEQYFRPKSSSRSDFRAQNGRRP